MRSPSPSPVPALPGARPVFPRLLRAMLCGWLAWMPLAAAGDFLSRAWESEDGLPGNVVRAVAQAADGDLWVAAAEGTVRFDGERFIEFDDPRDDLIARTPPRHLFALPDGVMCIAGVDGSLIVWREGRFQLLLEGGHDGGSRLAAVSEVRAEGRGLVLRRGEETWRSTRYGRAVRLEPGVDPPVDWDAADGPRRRRESGRWQPGVPDLRFRDRRDRLWRHSPALGLDVAFPDGRRVRVMEPGPSISCIAEDAEGNLWLAMETGGLRQIRERRVEMRPLRDSAAVPTVVMQDRAGVWWLGDRAGGVERFDAAGSSQHPLGDTANPRAASALFEDREGRLWAATSDGSVFRWAGSGFDVMFQGEGFSKVAAITEDREGRLWLGGSYGLAWWDGSAHGLVGPDQGLHGSVRSLAADPRGGLWAGTQEGALFRIRQARAEPVREALPLANGHAISALLVESEGRLWVTTHGAGLLTRAPDGRWRAIGPARGLPDRRLTAVVADASGDLWLGSLGGIFRARRADLLGDEEWIPWLRLDRSDGLLTRECLGMGQPPAWLARDGSLWFPTTRGVATLRPDNIRLHSSPPPIRLDLVATRDAKLAAPEERLDLGRGDSRLEFQWSSATFTAPEKVRFRARLHGLDEEWRDLGAQRAISYEAVPPGDYRFEVIAINGDGVASERPAELAIHIPPRWRQTAWIRVGLPLVLALAATAAAWYFTRRRLKRRIARMKLRHARETERARIARDLHDDLGASLTEISLLAGIAAEDAPSPCQRETLDEITAKTRHLVESLDEIVWAIDPRHDSPHSLVEYLASQGQEFLAKAGIFLRLDLPRDLPMVEIEPDRRHSLFLAVREAMHNLAKHSGSRTAWLRVAVRDGVLAVVVVDQGVGFDLPEAGRGNGLRNLGERMAACGGSVSFTSAHGSGTRVEMRMPLRATESPPARRKKNGPRQEGRPV